MTAIEVNGLGAATVRACMVLAWVSAWMWAAPSFAAGTGSTPAFVAAAPADANPALPTDSVYHLQAQLVDHQGLGFVWGAHRGQPMLVSMFYTSCQFVCPLLIETVRATQTQLSASERAALPVLLISIDPARDTVAVLKQTAEQRLVGASNWQLARTDAASVRRLAAVLGVQYRELGNGDFNHSTAVILLDAQGRIAALTTQLGSADPAFVLQVKAALGQR
jgi:protein SCO1